jgi:hypothetical protein
LFLSGYKAGFLSALIGTTEVVPWSFYISRFC